MNRRAFLRLMGLSAAGAAAGVLDPELLTWQPGAKVYSLPPVQVSVVFSSRDIQIADFAERFLRPAAKSMAQEIDELIMRTLNPMAGDRRIVQGRLRPRRVTLG